MGNKPFTAAGPATEAHTTTSFTTAAGPATEAPTTSTTTAAGPATEAHTTPTTTVTDAEEGNEDERITKLNERIGELQRKITELEGNKLRENGNGLDDLIIIEPVLIDTEQSNQGEQITQLKEELRKSYMELNKQLRRNGEFEKRITELELKLEESHKLRGSGDEVDSSNIPKPGSINTNKPKEAFMEKGTLKSEEGHQTTLIEEKSIINDLIADAKKLRLEKSALEAKKDQQAMQIEDQTVHINELTADIIKKKEEIDALKSETHNCSRSISHPCGDTLHPPSSPILKRQIATDSFIELTKELYKSIKIVAQIRSVYKNEGYILEDFVPGLTITPEDEVFEGSFPPRLESTRNEEEMESSIQYIRMKSRADSHLEVAYNSLLQFQKRVGSDGRLIKGMVAKDQSFDEAGFEGRGDPANTSPVYVRSLSENDLLKVEERLKEKCDINIWKHVYHKLAEKDIGSDGDANQFYHCEFPGSHELGKEIGEEIFKSHPTITLNDIYRIKEELGCKKKCSAAEKINLDCDCPIKDLPDEHRLPLLYTFGEIHHHSGACWKAVINKLGIDEERIKEIESHVLPRIQRTPFQETFHLLRRQSPDVSLDSIAEILQDGGGNVDVVNELNKVIMELRSQKEDEGKYLRSVSRSKSFVHEENLETITIVFEVTDSHSHVNSFIEGRNMINSTV